MAHGAPCLFDGDRSDRRRWFLTRSVTRACSGVTASPSPP